MFKNCAICLLSLAYLTSCDNANNYPTNKIKQGTLNGKYMKTRNGQQFSAFLSIPYAEPPIGDLRFKDPIAAKAWEGVLDASKPHAVCPQMGDGIGENRTATGDENCLFLSVYTPQLQNVDKKLYAVMIYIHGGGYAAGSGLQHGPDFLLDENVVLVTINYRLAVFGFFTTGDGVVPGNNGLKDQTMAVKWVHDNIKAFGGDPERITIFGESSGASSVHLHLFSPLSKGLFNRAISQSGTAFNTWTLRRSTLLAETSKQLARLLECPTQDHRKMVDCLQAIDAYKIIEKNSINWEEYFIPVVEFNHTGAFLPEHPLDTLKSGKFVGVPWIAGFNSEEGAMATAYLYSSPSRVRDLNDDFTPIISEIFENAGNNLDKISKKIKHFYFGNKRIDNSTRWNFINMYTDALFSVAHDAAVKLHYQYSKQPVYSYLYSHQGVNSFGRTVEDGSLRQGASHGDELFLLFPVGVAVDSQELDEFDKYVSRLLAQLWANFAKTGKPTPELNSFISTKWKPVKSDDVEYYYIGSGVHTIQNLYSDRLKFWKKLDFFPNINDKICD